MDNNITFFVYALCKPNGSPFYIGKGKRRQRPSDHLREARNGHHCYRCHTIRHIWADGGNPHPIILYRTPDEQDAYRMECALIAAIGRDLLTNATDGGEGQSGRVGELNAGSKLTYERVRELRCRYAEETTPIKTLAADFGISVGLVEQVVSQRRWGKDPSMPTKRDPQIGAANSRANRNPNSPKGEQQRDAKLTWKKAAEIRTRYATSGISTVEIARHYDITPRVVHKVLTNKGWHDPSYDPSVYIPHKPAGRGERNQGARLTWEQVREIRARYQFHKVTAKMLAAEYGVTSNHIEKILRGELWRE